MSDDKEMVFVGRRDGEIVGFWRGRPTMMDVPAGKRTQDADLVFEEMPADHADVVAFVTRPPPAPKAGAVETRVAALEAKFADLEAARAVKP